MITRKRRAPVPASPGTGAQRAMAEAAERARSRYLHLECGHWCPQEVRELYRVFGDGTGVFCEHRLCGDFRKVITLTSPGG